MRRKKATAGLLILSLCAGISLHRIQAGSFGGFEIDVEEGADSQQWKEEDMGSTPEGESVEESAEESAEENTEENAERNTEETESIPDQNVNAPFEGENDRSDTETESTRSVGENESTGGGENESAKGGENKSTGEGKATSVEGGENKNARGRDKWNKNTRDGERKSTGGEKTKSDRDRRNENVGTTGKKTSELKADGGAEEKLFQFAAAGPVIASTGISLLSAPLKYYNNINNNIKKIAKSRKKYTEKEIFQGITEKDENDMVCITLLQDVDVTIVSLRLNGQEASWYSENRKIFLDSPVSKKNSIVEMVVLVNGVQLCSSPVWEIS